MYLKKSGGQQTCEKDQHVAQILENETERIGRGIKNQIHALLGLCNARLGLCKEGQGREVGPLPNKVWIQEKPELDTHDENCMAGR